MNEFELISHLTEGAPSSGPDVVAGIGDDCAVIAAGDHHMLVTTDALVEGVHFSLAFITPFDLGQRILNVNISDIAAMGGRPRFFTTALGIPEGMEHDRLRELYDGMFAAARNQSTVLIGGDITSCDQLTASITVIGESAKGAAILRSGAKPGDALYVTGQLGWAALGLVCLKGGATRNDALPFIERYRVPSPRVTEGQKLAATGFVTSMIDISDGLMADVDHLAQASKTGYEISVDTLPGSASMDQTAHLAGVDLLQLMLGGGDDYELAFTVAQKHERDFSQWAAKGGLGTDVELTRIGTMIADTQRRLALRNDGTVIEVAVRGYNHFSEDTSAP